MNTLVINKSHKAVNLAFVPHKMVVFMEDGREISFPLTLFPYQADVTNEIQQPRRSIESKGGNVIKPLGIMRNAKKYGMCFLHPTTPPKELLLRIYLLPLTAGRWNDTETRTIW